MENLMTIINTIFDVPEEMSLEDFLQIPHRDSISNYSDIGILSRMTDAVEVNDNNMGIVRVTTNCGEDGGPKINLLKIKIV